MDNSSPIEITPIEFDMLVICSFRYALGRKTYVVSDFADFVKKYTKHITPNAANIMIRGINYAVEHDMAGMECDVEVWKDLKHFLETR